MKTKFPLISQMENLFLIFAVVRSDWYCMLSMVKYLDTVLEEVSLSRVRLFATPWKVAYQPLLSIGFSRQAYWSGLPFPSPGDLPNPGIEPWSPALHTDALPLSHQGSPDTVLEADKSKRSSALSSKSPVYGFVGWLGIGFQSTDLNVSRAVEAPHRLWKLVG